MDLFTLAVGQVRLPERRCRHCCEPSRQALPPTSACRGGPPSLCCHRDRARQLFIQAWRLRPSSSAAAVRLPSAISERRLDIVALDRPTASSTSLSSVVLPECPVPVENQWDDRSEKRALRAVSSFRSVPAIADPRRVAPGRSLASSRRRCAPPRSRRPCRCRVRPECGWRRAEPRRCALNSSAAHQVRRPVATTIARGTGQSPRPLHRPAQDRETTGWHGGSRHPYR